MNDGWSHLERLKDAQGDAIAALASAALNAKRVATVIANAAGNLEVIVWELDYEGAVVRLGSKEGGATTRVAIAALSPRGCVTAARTEAGTLKLTFWEVDEDG